MIEKVYGNESTKDATKLSHKVVLVASENEHKHELSVTTRRGAGGGRVVGGAGVGNRGVIGGTGHAHNAAPSLFRGNDFWVPKFILYVSLTLITFFH